MNNTNSGNEQPAGAYDRSRRGPTYDEIAVALQLARDKGLLTAATHRAALEKLAAARERFSPFEVSLLLEQFLSGYEQPTPSWFGDENQAPRQQWTNCLRTVIEAAEGFCPPHD